MGIGQVGAVAERTCSGPCGRRLPWTSEHFYARGSGRLEYSCKACQRQVRRELWARQRAAWDARVLGYRLTVQQEIDADAYQRKTDAIAQRRTPAKQAEYVAKHRRKVMADPVLLSRRRDRGRMDRRLAVEREGGAVGDGQRDLTGRDVPRVNARPFRLWLLRMMLEALPDMNPEPRPCDAWLLRRLVWAAEREGSWQAGDFPAVTIYEHMARDRRTRMVGIDYVSSRTGVPDRTVRRVLNGEFPTVSIDLVDGAFLRAGEPYRLSLLYSDDAPAPQAMGQNFQFQTFGAYMEWREFRVHARRLGTALRLPRVVRDEFLADPEHPLAAKWLAVDEQARGVAA